MQLNIMKAVYPYPPLTDLLACEKQLDYSKLPLDTWGEVIEEATLFEDEYSKLCFNYDTDLAELVIRVVTKLKLKIVNVAIQSSKKVGPKLHGVIFDVYAEDSNGNHHVIEIQNRPSGMPIQRVGYYAMMLQFHNLPTGVSYTKMPKLHMIILSRKDLFHRGKLHSMINARWDNGEICEGIGINVHCIAAEYATEKTAIGRLMLDWNGTSRDNIHYEVIDRLAHRFKKTEDGIKEMTEAYRRAIEAEIAIGVAKGFEQGRNETLYEVVDNMLLNPGLSVELIASYTKASLELVKQRSLIVRGK